LRGHDNIEMDTARRHVTCVRHACWKRFGLDTVS